MVKMHNIRRTKADVAEEQKALGADRKGDVVHPYVPPEDEGARMEFEGDYNLGKARTIC